MSAVDDSTSPDLDTDTGEPRIVVIGGGTGSFAILQALKEVTSNITAIVGMVDDGGSSGVLRDELGILPPGDVRQCLIALSDAPNSLRELFKFRFDSGALSGHSLGNLFIAAAEKITDNFAEAIQLTSDVLRIRGQVLPVTLDNVHLVLQKKNGERVLGQSTIDVMKLGANVSDVQLSLEPAATINPAARKAIAVADLVVIAPGDIYTSLGPALIVPGVADALAASPATIVYMCNLVSKPGHTDGFTVAYHASEIERFAGPVLDYVCYNTAQPLPDLLSKYAKKGEMLVSYNIAELDEAQYKAVGWPLIASGPAIANTHDHLIRIQRSLIRHDPAQVRVLIQSLLKEKSSWPNTTVPVVEP